MTAFGLSDTFSYLHLTVRAKDGKGANFLLYNIFIRIKINLFTRWFDGRL
jgi:hypothetical protein